MAFLFRTHLRLACVSIKENRTRSFLTCLGIAIGIASIILILSLTGSISNLIADEIQDIGSDLIVVRPSTTKDSVTTVIEELTSANSFQKSNLALSDIEAISKINQVSAVVPIAVAYGTVANEDNVVASATILGTTPEFDIIEPTTMRYGTFLNNKNQENSVVIGHMLSLLIFNTSNPIGRTLKFHDKTFMVVGVLEEDNNTINFDNIDFNNALIMNVNMLEQTMGSLQVQQINVRVTSTDVLPTVSAAISSTLTEAKHGDTNFTVAYGNDITHPASALLNIIAGMLAIVAGVALVVGGIGVMNIMLVSVAERTHEIGIRKAVGASFGNIVMQFMFESLILSVLDGFLGVILGYVLAFLVSIVTPFTPYISWQILAITFCTTLIVGIVFGIYPALKAANRNPIESLKHYR